MGLKEMGFKNARAARPHSLIFTTMEDEMETRILLVSKIHESCRHSPSYRALKRAGFWSMLMILDMSVLFELLHELQTASWMERIRLVCGLGPVAQRLLVLVKICMTSLQPN